MVGKHVLQGAPWRKILQRWNFPNLENGKYAAGAEGWQYCPDLDFSDALPRMALGCTILYKRPVR